MYLGDSALRNSLGFRNFLKRDMPEIMRNKNGPFSLSQFKQSVPEGHPKLMMLNKSERVPWYLSEVLGLKHMAETQPNHSAYEVIQRIGRTLIADGLQSLDPLA